MNLKNYIPALEWLPNYSTSQFKGDLSAGLTVGVMLIPQGMAYAMIAGMPPIYGLYASTIPLILYAIFGTSRQLAVGPVAMVSLLTAAGIGAMAEGGTEMYITLAIALAVFVGITQLLLGVLRLGFLVNFLSHPVISGFTSAAALIIGLSQLKHLLGIDIARSHHIHEILLEALSKIGAVNLPTFLIGVVGILLIVFITKISRNIPGPLVAVAFGILIVWSLGLTESGVKIVGEIPKGLPAFTIPTLDMSNLSELIPIALTISLVGFMESIAVAKALQAKHRNYKVRPNQELIALGIANIGGSFFQAFPTTGGFSRTAVNDQAGAKTGLASVLSALLILLTLLFLTPLFYYLPNAILASVIMVAVYGLIDVKEAIHLWQSNRTDFFMLLATFIATLTLGIEQGIGVGVVLSLAMVIFRTTQPHVAVLGRIPNTHFYRNVSRFSNLKERDDLLIFRFDAQLYFANSTFFKDWIEEQINRKGDALKAVIMHTGSMTGLDSSGAHALEEIVDLLRSRGIQLFLTDMRGPVRDAMVRSHLNEKIGTDNFFMNVQRAVDFFDSHPEWTKDLDRYTLQTNTISSLNSDKNHAEQ